MNKIIKSASLFVLTALLVCVGVYAATTYTHNSNSNIDFVVGDVNMTASAKIDSGSTNYLDVTSAVTKDTTTLESWTPTSDITLTSTNYTVTYTFTFTNNCIKSTDVTITPPTGTAALLVSGGLKNGEVYNGNTVTLANKGDSAIFTYTITLQDFTADITNAPMNFTIKMDLTV